MSNPKENIHRQTAIDFAEWDFGQDAEKKSTDDNKQIEKPSDNMIPDTSIYYMSFGSGSSGNCCYIGTRKDGILIDAGVRSDTIITQLRANGVSMDMVKAICLTHDHADHVRYAYNLIRKYKHIRLFCTNRVLNGILRKHNVSKRIKDYHVAIFKEIPFKIGTFELTAFDVPHDGEDNMGFSINIFRRKFVIATDLGKVKERAYHYMSQANYLMIEANYDDDMLRKGPYPEYLKYRIKAESGHLDNVETAQFLYETASKEMQYVFLCHLSNDNNTPEIAVTTIKDALLRKGLTVGYATESIEDRKADIQLMALPRLECTRWFVFH